MSRLDRALPVRMQRIAVVAPATRLRATLVTLAEAGCVELTGGVGAAEGDAVDAVRRLERAGGLGAAAAPALARTPIPIPELERRRAVALLAGEIELRRRAAGAIAHRGTAIFLGWAPRHRVGTLGEALAGIGGAVVELSAPPGVEPPSLLAPAAPAGRFGPLVELYGAVPYGDLDPTPFAAAAYFLMFGIMFGDVGDGLLLVAAALVLRAGLGGRRLARVRAAWPFVLAAGASGIAFGLLYGEFFGPTGVVPALWMAPLDDPTRLLAVAVGVGALLLTASGVLGTVNRWREAGPAAALLAPSGAVGLALLVGGLAVAAGLAAAVPAIVASGVAIGTIGVAALLAGTIAETPKAAGRVAGIVVSTAETLMRVFSNVFSFTRLAAFGLVHAAVGQVVYNGAVSLWGGPAGILAATLLFVAGSAIALALEGLVVAIQALRLEYYELFSRIFAREGRPFAPWRLPVTTLEESP